MANLASLKALFVAGSGMDNFDVANQRASSLLSFGEWMRMVRAFELIDMEFTVRDAGLAFVCAPQPRTHTRCPQAPGCTQCTQCTTEIARHCVRVPLQLWSRMRVVDDTARKSRPKLESLSLEDFYEALIHVALMKATPTHARRACTPCTCTLS